MAIPKRAMAPILVFLASILLETTPGQAITLFDDRAAWETTVGGSFLPVDIAGQVPDSTILSTGNPLFLPSGGTLTFNKDLEGRQVPGSWNTWSGGKTPAVLFLDEETAVNTVIGTFNAPQAAFGLEMEPNNFSTFNVTLLLSDGSSLTQLVDGDGGAKFFGWAAGAITSFTQSCETGCEGFATGEIVQGTQRTGSVPSPSTLILIGSGLVGLAAVRSWTKR